MLKKVFNFSLTRWFGVVLKEMHELRRDKISICMIFLIPIFQLVILGYAVNMDPRNIPASLLNYDGEQMSQTFVKAAENTGYFSVIPVASENEAQKAFIRGDVIFMITIPQGFSHNVLRGEKPQILIEGDAIDPMMSGNALSALSQASKTLLRHDVPDSVSSIQENNSDLYELVIHKMFNPENITRYSSIPGIIGSILGSTLVLMTALAITRERENGAMENLLISPVTGMEVILGKITPYIVVGIFQSVIILTFAAFLFDIPVLGSVTLLLFVLMVYIFLCLSIGICISSIAQNQLQALQISSFYFVPSIMLSGFISPFIGMPVWAQYIGACMPLTYFIRLVKSIMLKGYTVMDVMPDLLPLLAMAFVVIFIGIKSYRQTLD